MVWTLVDSIFAVVVLLGFVAACTYAVGRGAVRLGESLERHRDNAVVREATRVTRRSAMTMPAGLARTDDD